MARIGRSAVLGRGPPTLLSRPEIVGALRVVRLHSRSPATCDYRVLEKFSDFVALSAARLISTNRINKARERAARGENAGEGERRLRYTAGQNEGVGENEVNGK